MKLLKHYKPGLEFLFKIPNSVYMKSEQEKHRLWFESVVSPKIESLKEISQNPNEIRSFEAKKFFKEFLADLELLSLDNYSTEVQVDRILLAMTIIQDPFFQTRPEDLRDVALISSLQNFADRLLFWSKWRKYQLFLKSYGSVQDATILDAYRISILIQSFVLDISHRIDLLLQGGPAQVDAQAS